MNIKACQHILIHQTLKIMIFKIASYDPFNLRFKYFTLKGFSWQKKFRNFWPTWVSLVHFGAFFGPSHSCWLRIAFKISHLCEVLLQLGCLCTVYILNKIINATLLLYSSLKHTCAIIMLSNQHLDMPHLWGGWIISAKEKCSLTQI